MSKGVEHEHVLQKKNNERNKFFGRERGSFEF